MSAAVGPVTSAVLARRSVRRFKAQPVAAKTLSAIVAAGLRAPSGGNLQPWHIHVVHGDALARLKTTVRAAQEEGRSEAPNHPVYPDGLWEPYRSRRFENGEDLYRTIGIDRADKAGRLKQLAENYQLFGAPVGLFFAIDRRMGRAQWIDLGMVMQTVMLVAVEHGLATCPQAAWALWPDTLRDFLGLDDGVTIAAGMALGFEDDAHPINRLRTTRQAVEEGVSWHE